MIYIDSSYFIALMNKKDVKKHERAKELYPQLAKEDKITSVFMLSETITYLNSRINTKKVRDFYEIILDTVGIYYPNSIEVDENMNCVIKYNGSSSFADCYAVYIMNKLDITEIYSFDSDFDNMEGIIRIY